MTSSVRASSDFRTVMPSAPRARRVCAQHQRPNPRAADEDEYIAPSHAKPPLAGPSRAKEYASTSPVGDYAGRAPRLVYEFTT